MDSRPLLVEARKSAGLTQQELASRLGVDQAVISRWESGAREPGVKAAVRLARELDTTADAIWAPDPEKRPRRPHQRSRGQATSEVTRCDGKDSTRGGRS